jgi:hypothetical protein
MAAGCGEVTREDVIYPAETCIIGAWTPRKKSSFSRTYHFFDESLTNERISFWNLWHACYKHPVEGVWYDCHGYTNNFRKLLTIPRN